MAIAEELRILIQVEADKAVKNLNKVEKQTGKSEKGFKKFTKFLSTSGVGSFLAVGATVAGVTKFLSDSEKAARDAQEVLSKYDFVFDSMGSAAEDAATQFADSFGLADSTAKELLGTTGDLLVGMGATEGQALDLAAEVNTLAADLASFSNIEGGTERASKALTAALLGEREQAKMLGVVIREADVQQKLMENGQQDLTGQSLLLAKAQATLELATEQSTKAMGDYERTQDSAANVSRRAEEATKALKEAIGTSVVEAVTPFKRAWANVAEQLSEVIKKQRELKDAQTSMDEGTATIEQQILVLKTERKELAAASDDYADFVYGEGERDKRVDDINESIAALQQWQLLVDSADNAERRAAQKRAEDAQADAEAAAERQKDLDALNDAWADTTAGEIAATEASIRYFESFIQTEKVKAVLADLRGQLEDLKDDGVEYTETLEAGFRMYEVTALDTLDGVGAATKLLGKTQEETASIFEQTYAQIGNSTSQVVGSLSTVWSNYYEKQLEGLEEGSQEHKRILREQAAAEKGMATFQVAIDTATAIIGFLADPGGIPGAIMSVAAGAAGVAQAAAINSAPMPALAEGGVVTKPTNALIGEAGPEAVVPLNKGGIGTTVNVYNMGTAIMQEQFENSVVAAVARGNRGY